MTLVDGKKRIDLEAIEIIDYNPNDVIVVELKNAISQAEIAEIYKRVKSIFKNNQVLVLDRNARMFSLRGQVIDAEVIHDS